MVQACFLKTFPGLCRAAAMGTCPLTLAAAHTYCTHRCERHRLPHAPSGIAHSLYPSETSTKTATYNSLDLHAAASIAGDSKEISLSVEETNELRAKLGLKPLRVDDGPKEGEGQYSTDKRPLLSRTLTLCVHWHWRFWFVRRLHPLGPSSARPNLLIILVLFRIAPDLSTAIAF